MSSDKNSARIKLIYNKVREHQVEEAWKRFINAGFKPLLIKGWAATQFYNDPADRFYNDIDLIIDPVEFEKATKFIPSLEGDTAIDLHKGARHLDNISYENLYKNSRIVKCGETLIRVLRPEDHLRILCVHWLNDGGARKDRLWDIYYAVANRPKDFDWDRCLNSVSEKRKKWIVCTIGLAQKYLRLDLKDTPLENVKIEIPEWIIKTLEREWKNYSPIIPLHYSLNDKKQLWQQIKKRIPPNAIQATIEMEGEFDDKPRIFYQLGDIFWRLVPSFKRVVERLFGKQR